MQCIQKFIQNIISLLFPSLYSEKYLTAIPSAPENNIPRVFSLYDYRHPKGKELVYYIKKYQDISLQKKIAEHMYEHTIEYISEQQLFGYYKNAIITIVPLTKKSQRKRGFNQSSNIAQFLSQKYHGNYLEIFVKNRETLKQALIHSKRKRLLNVKDSFSLKDNIVIKDKDIIIIDDLVTTGSTLQELFTCAQKHRVRNIIAITIAH